MTDKRFFIYILIGTLSILLCIACFNYKYDPGNIFDNKKMNIAVNYLLKGEAVSNLSNYDERVFKKTLIEKETVKPNIIVLGSSRSMGIREDFFQKNKVLKNYSVSGATLEDELGLWFLADKYSDNTIEKVIFTADAWIFNANHGDTRWLSIDEEYDGCLNLLKVEKENVVHHNFFSKYWELISLTYFRASIKECKREDSYPRKAENSDGNTNVIMPDYSLKNSQKINDISSDLVDRKVIQVSSQKEIYHLENFYELNNDRKIIFEKFMDYLKDKNIEVILYLTPYHPLFYKFLSSNEKYKMVLETEKYLLNYAEKNNIRIVGSYDPELCGLRKEDFIDEMHLKDKSYDKIFAKL